jgi:hypothetical protein
MEKPVFKEFIKVCMVLWLFWFIFIHVLNYVWQKI